MKTVEHNHPIMIDSNQRPKYRYLLVGINWFLNVSPTDNDTSKQVPELAEINKPINSSLISENNQHTVHQRIRHTLAFFSSDEQLQMGQNLTSNIPFWSVIR